MDRSTPKIRFGIAPGSSARMAEREQESEEARARMQISGGTAARKAEGEARAATARPYSIRMQARTGKPFSLADAAAMEAQSQVSRRSQREEAVQAESTKSVSEARLHGSGIRSSSFRPVAERNQVSVPAGELPVFEEGRFDGINERETQTPPRSPFQTLRDLFSRTLPEQGKKKP